MSSCTSGTGSNGTGNGKGRDDPTSSRLASVATTTIHGDTSFYRLTVHLSAGRISGIGDTCQRVLFLGSRLRFSESSRYSRTAFLVVTQFRPIFLP